MNADEPQPKPWSQHSSDELLDLAQAAATFEMALTLTQAAQVRASAELVWQLEVRFLPMLTNAIWEGLRTTR